MSSEDDTREQGVEFGPLGGKTYESAEDVIQDVVGNVSTEAVGRENYTDRGGGPPGEEQSDEESL